MSKTENALEEVLNHVSKAMENLDLAIKKGVYLTENYPQCPETRYLIRHGYNLANAQLAAHEFTKGDR